MNGPIKPRGNMIDPPDGELLTSDTAHGVPIDRLRKVGPE